MRNKPTAETSTALALPAATDLAALFKSENGLTGLLDKLEATVKAEAENLDASTQKGRDGLKSLAYKVSQSKAEMDRQGLALTEKARAEIAAVNAGRKAATERLDALRDETKRPVTEWEAKEAARVDAHKIALKAFDLDRATAQDTPSHIREVIAGIDGLTLGSSWDEFEEFAEAKSKAALDKYRADLVAAEKRVADEDELAKLRAEAAERAKRDAEEAERKAEAERQQEAARRAEQERAEAVKREAERQAQIERAREEASRHAAEAAKAEAERAAKEAAERHARELAEAKAREERAAQAERDRIAAEQKAKDDARAKREADQAHRDRIRGDIIKALESMRGAATPGDIADALMGGKIPHVEVTI